MSTESQSTPSAGGLLFRSSRWLLVEVLELLGCGLMVWGAISPGINWWLIALGASACLLGLALVRRRRKDKATD